jgi:hypothetical protein
LIYNHIIEHGSISIIDADKMKIRRLASRIGDLKKNGIVFNDDEWIGTGRTKIRSYSIKKP